MPRTIEQVKEYNRQWAALNRDKRRAASQRWYERNVEKQRARGRQWQADNRSRVDQRFVSSRSKAKTRGLAWEISLEQYAALIGGRARCHYYCDRPLPATGVGLDRKDNSLGYLPDNVVPCCRFHNTKKSDFWDYDLMLEQCRRHKEKQANVRH